MRWTQRGLSPVWTSVVGVVVFLIAAYFIFTKELPFRHHDSITAVMRNSNLLAPGSPVRVGGLDVGKVTSVGRWHDTNLAAVHIRLDDHRPAIHDDASLQVRPRLFLEGNFYGQLTTGTPSAPRLGDGGVIGVDHTAAPVQLDQVLDTLTAPVRRQLQVALAGLGQSLDGRPTYEEDRNADPRVRGLSGAQGLNKAFDTSVGALRDSGVTADALNGPDGRALSKLVAGIGRAGEGLNRADGSLSTVVTDFDRTLQATASQQDALRQTVSLLGPTARSLNSGFASVDAALPSTERFSDELASGMRALPATLAAAGPWLTQAQPLLSQSELRGLLTAIAPASGAIAHLTADTTQFLPQIDRFDRCMNDVFIPTGYLKLKDGAASSKMPNYQEFFSAMTAMAAEGQASDGNGPLLTIGATGGSHPVESGQTNYYGNIDTGFGNLAAAPLATHPAYPNSVPPLQRAKPCYQQPIPDVNGPDAAGPADGSNPNGKRPPLPVDPTRSLTP